MLWRMPADTHAQRIDRWPPPDNRRSTSGRIANAPMTVACSAPPWARYKNDRRKDRKGRKALAALRRAGFVNDFNRRAGPLSGGRKVPESTGKSPHRRASGDGLKVGKMVTRDCPLRRRCFFAAIPCVEWRRGWDSNPRYACTHNGFRDRPDRPLWHLSRATLIGGRLPPGNRPEVRRQRPVFAAQIATFRR